MKRKKKILFLATGGTIASVSTPDGLAPGLSASQLLSYQTWSDLPVDITARTLLHLDSANMQPQHWQQLARKIYAGRNEYQGVIITHGTDTMAYTSTALSFMLPGLPMPVVLTGSSLPINVPESDGPANLSQALLVASSGRAGVQLVYNGEIIKGCRASKSHSDSPDPFASINTPLEGQIRKEEVQYSTDVTGPGDGPFRCRPALEPRVLALKLLPGLPPAILETIIRAGYRGLVLESFGLGGVPSCGPGNLLPGLQACRQAGLPVVIGTQCSQGPVNLDRYQVGREAAQLDVIPGGDMSREALCVKLMWVLGQSGERASIRDLMLHNYCGEISPDHQTL